MPGDTAAKVVQTKELQHKDDFDEWLAHIACFAFSVPPQRVVKPPANVRDLLIGDDRKLC